MELSKKKPTPMRKLVATILLLLLLFVLIWVLEAFCLWEINPSLWTVGERAGVVCVWVICGIFIGGFSLFNTN